MALSYYTHKICEEQGYEVLYRLEFKGYCFGFKTSLEQNLKLLGMLLSIVITRLTKMDIFMSIIDTKPVFASRKEGWPSDSKKRHQQCSFSQLWFVGFVCPDLFLWRTI